MATKPNTVVNPFEGVVQVVSESAKSAKFALPVEQLSVIDNALEGFFKADSMVFNAKEIMRKSAGGIAKVLGIAPTYTHWMGVRDVTIGRMMAMRSAMSEDTAKTYWEKVIGGSLKAEFHLEKPSSKGAEAEKNSVKPKPRNWKVLPILSYLRKPRNLR